MVNHLCNHVMTMDLGVLARQDTKPLHWDDFEAQHKQNLKRALDAEALHAGHEKIVADLEEVAANAKRHDSTSIAMPKGTPGSGPDVTVSPSRPCHLRYCTGAS